jgi:hypothetical protein
MSIKSFFKSFFEELCKEPNCKVCKDSGSTERQVMGTDTESGNCEYCSKDPKYKAFQESLKNKGYYNK